MTPLATIADLTARGVVVSTDETPIVTVALDVASAAVREAAGGPIVSQTDTLTVESPRDTRLTPPGGPVTAVDAVAVDGVPVTDWQLVSGALVRPCGWGCTVTLTYTHGLAAVPADVVDLVCRLAARALVAYRNDPSSGGLGDKPIQTESIGEYSVTYAYPGQATVADIPPFQRVQLARRFGRGSLVQVMTR